MKKIVFLTVFLAIISGVAGGALAYVNQITAPIIEKMSIEKEKANLVLLFPDATFKEIDFKDDSKLVKGAYEAEGKALIYRVEVNGYSSAAPISFMIAFDFDGKVSGFTVLNHQETSGFGSRVATDEYKSIVVGKTCKDEFPLLSGATVSTTAVVKGINAAKAVFEASKGMK